MKKIYLLSALFMIAQSVCATIYSRVAAKPQEGWAGQYILVYEASDTKAYVWNGQDESSNFVTATIASGKITADNLGDYVITIASEGNNKYSLKTKDGYLYTEAKSNGLDFDRGAHDCTIASNGGYAIIETNTNTCRLLFYNNSRFRFYYDKDKKWADTKYKNVYLYVVGDQDVQESANALDINYAQAELYACESKFPSQSNPYDQYFSTFLWLLQEEDENAVPQVGLEILAPTQYSIAGTYKSNYTDGQKYYLNITAGSKHSYFTFPSKAEAGYSTAAITVAELTITKVGVSSQPNAYTYHVKLEFTDSNRKIWKLDKDLDIYAWWIDCDRSDSKNLQDMEPVAFALESGNHNSQTALPSVEDNRRQSATKVIRNGHVYWLFNGQMYDILGNKITK